MLSVSSEPAISISATVAETYKYDAHLEAALQSLKKPGIAGFTYQGTLCAHYAALEEAADKPWLDPCQSYCCFDAETTNTALVSPMSAMTLVGNQIRTTFLYAIFWRGHILAVNAAMWMGKILRDQVDHN